MRLLSKAASKAVLLSSVCKNYSGDSIQYVFIGVYMPKLGSAIFRIRQKNSHEILRERLILLRSWGKCCAV